MVKHRRSAAEKYAYRAGFNAGDTFAVCDEWLTDHPYWIVQSRGWERFAGRNCGGEEGNILKIHYELGFDTGHRGDPPAEEWA